MESAAAADTGMQYEKILTHQVPPDRKYAFEERNGTLVRQYSSEFATAYNNLLKGMVERRMRASIKMIGDFWYSAWVDAGQPDLRSLIDYTPTEDELAERRLELQLMRNNRIRTRDHETDN